MFKNLIIMTSILVLAQIKANAVVIQNTVEKTLVEGGRLNIRQVLTKLMPNDFVNYVEIEAYGISESQPNLQVIKDNQLFSSIYIDRYLRSYRFTINAINNVNYKTLFLRATGGSIVIKKIRADVIKSISTPTPGSQFQTVKYSVYEKINNSYCSKLDIHRIESQAIHKCQSAGARNCVIESSESESKTEVDPNTKSSITGSALITVCYVYASAQGEVLDSLLPGYNVGNEPNSGYTNTDVSSQNSTNQTVIVNGNNNNVSVTNNTNTQVGDNSTVATQDQSTDVSHSSNWTCRFATAYNPAPGYGSTKEMAAAQARSNCLDIQFSQGGIISYLCPLSAAICSSY